MNQESNEQQPTSTHSESTTWGPKLFWGALVAILLFFYWLLIYSGGAVVHHG
jgi:hypothetical protein